MTFSKTGPMSDVYKFQLVEFILRGPKSKRVIDIVPSLWINTKDGKKVVSKFMPPPYTPENNELLHSLVKANADAPESWPLYSIQIKGQAKTYDEAMEKLEKLQTAQFAFTTDSDLDPATKAVEISKKLIKAKKYTLSEETRNAMLVPPINSDVEDDPSDLRKDISTGKETSSSSNDGKKRAQKHRKTFPSKSSSHVPSQKKSTPTVSSGLKIPKKKPIPKMPAMVQKQVRNANSLEYETAKSNCKNIPQKKKGGDFASLVSLLKGIAIDVEEVLANQNAILLQLNAIGDRVFEQKFAEKHSLSLPFQSHPEFFQFDEKLRVDDEFRKEFISSLDSLLDRELTLSKSLTNMCKKYLSRNVALKYTVLRKVTGKSVLKDTVLRLCSRCGNSDPQRPPYRKQSY